MPSSISQIIQHRTYTCLPGESGLEFIDESNDRTEYEADISQYLPLTTPKLTKAGKIAAHQPHIPSQSKQWWKAQCGFRGLSVSGSISDLQRRIREHGDKGLGVDIKDAFARMERDYDQQIWGVQDDNEKATSLPKRFLEETLGAQGSRRDKVLVVKVKDWGNAMEKLTREMGISCEMKKLPEYKTGERLVVVGNDRLAVSSKWALINRDAQRAAQRLQREQEKAEAAAQAEFDRKLKAAKSKEKNLKGKWDVRGSWEIKCPAIEEQWSEGDKLRLDIGFTKPDRNGLVQMYADFDFNIITGIMRFIGPDGPSNHSVGKPKAKRDAGDHSDDGDDSDDSGDSDDCDELDEDTSEDDEPTAPEYLLEEKLLPASTSKDFKFRWRGEETGEGEIQLGSDRKLCSLTFDSPHALSGIFKCTYVKDCEFKGVKVSSRSPRIDPEEAWQSRSAAEYESARVGRWG